MKTRSRILDAALRIVYTTCTLALSFLDYLLLHLSHRKVHDEEDMILKEEYFNLGITETLNPKI